MVECYLRDMMTLLVERALFLESSARATDCSLMKEPPSGYNPFVWRESHLGGFARFSEPDGGFSYAFQFFYYVVFEIHIWNEIP